MFMTNCKKQKTKKHFLLVNILSFIYGTIQTRSFTGIHIIYRWNERTDGRLNEEENGWINKWMID